MPDSASKRCTKCGETKPLDGFGKDRTRADGRFPWCRKCRRVPGAAERQADAAALAARGERRCATCKTARPLSAYGVRSASADGVHHTCRECVCGQVRRYAQLNPEQVRGKRRQYARDLKAQVLAVYGDTCACCGTTERLDLDHVNGNGREHRERLFGDSGRCGTEFYRWVIQNDFPADLSTLCRRCNLSKGKGEFCRLAHAAPLIG